MRAAATFYNLLHQHPINISLHSIHYDQWAIYAYIHAARSQLFYSRAVGWVGWRNQSRSESHQAWGEDRRKVSTTPWHRQTDDANTGPHAEDLAVLTKHARIFMHAHTYTQCYQTREVRGSWIPPLSGCLSTVFLSAMLSAITHLKSLSVCNREVT